MKYLSVNRSLSLVIAIFYLAWSVKAGGGEGLAVIPYLLIVLSFIWYGDYWGNYQGWYFSGPARPLYIDNPTPGILVKLFGWLFLILPLLLYLLS